MPDNFEGLYFSHLLIAEMQASLQTAICSATKLFDELWKLSASNMHYEMIFDYLRVAKGVKKLPLISEMRELSIGGSVVECSPATRATRVRFPANALSEKYFILL